MLYNLANQEGGFKSKKYFSVDRVFRNEAMDATHLCEFHQVEGLVIDQESNMSHLKGCLEILMRIKLMLIEKLEVHGMLFQ